MKKFFKTVFIVGLCGVGVIAIAHVVLGKHRTHDAAKALQSMAQSKVDELIAKQKDMKQELAALRAKYPHQIATLKSQLSDIDRQLGQLDKEESRANDIITLCQGDIDNLQKQSDVIGSVYTDERVINHRGSKYTPAEAEQLVTRISETREIYTTRLDDIKNEREVLAGEKDQITVELQSVQNEQAEFEAEYQSLVREIERLKRNDELLKIAENRQGIGDDGHSEAMATLDQVKSAVERARMEQEERLKAARVAPKSLDYETRAKLLELQRKRETRQKTQRTPETPTTDEQAEPEAEDDPLAVEFSNN